MSLGTSIYQQQYKRQTLYSTEKKKTVKVKGNMSKSTTKGNKKGQKMN